MNYICGSHCNKIRYTREVSACIAIHSGNKNPAGNPVQFRIKRTLFSIMRVALQQDPVHSRFLHSGNKNPAGNIFSFDADSICRRRSVRRKCGRSACRKSPASRRTWRRYAPAGWSKCLSSEEGRGKRGHDWGRNVQNSIPFCRKVTKVTFVWTRSHAKVWMPCGLTPQICWKLPDLENTQSQRRHSQKMIYISSKCPAVMYLPGKKRLLNRGRLTKIYNLIERKSAKDCSALKLLQLISKPLVSPSALPLQAWSCSLQNTFCFGN